MNHKERVLSAIEHRRPDRVPRGELAIEGEILKKLIWDAGFESMSPFERELEARRVLGADLINVHEYPMDQIGETDDGKAIMRGILGEEYSMTAHSSHLLRPAISDIAEMDAYEAPGPETCRTEMLEWFVANSDLFVMAQIMGPVSSLDWMLGMEDYLVWSMTDTDNVRTLSEKVVAYEVARARAFLDRGADAILIADDIAYNTGPFMPPPVMDELVWPIYRQMIQEIKAHKEVPVFMHTDGDIRPVLANIVDAGFDGLQSLQPSAGMDIAEVKREYGDHLCLMGNMDLDRLMTFGTPGEVTRQAAWLCDNIGADGGLILSTCNILTDSVPVANAMAMYGV